MLIKATGSLKKNPLIGHDSSKHTWLRGTYLYLITDQSQPKYISLRCVWVEISEY